MAGARQSADRSWWSRWWKRIAIVVGILVILFIGGSAVAAKFTESNKFCGTDCHEMWPYRDTWAKSTHKQVDCVKCHIAPGPVNFLKTKMAASREVWVHFTGLPKKPITVTRHIPNAACERSGCHTSAQTSKTVSLGQPAPVKFQHGSAGHTKQLCISCHASLVHAGAPGVNAPPANSMYSCFTCHNNGTKDCGYCHQAPHTDRGPCVELPQHPELDRRQGRRPASRRRAHRQARPGLVRDLPHQGRQCPAGRLHQLPRRRAQRPDELRPVPHDPELEPEQVQPSAGGRAHPRRRSPAAVQRLPPERIRPAGELPVPWRQPAERRRMSPA